MSSRSIRLAPSLLLLASLSLVLSCKKQEETTGPGGEEGGTADTSRVGAAQRARVLAPWPKLEDSAGRVGGGEKDAAVVVGLESYQALPAVPGATENAKHWHRYLTEDLRVPVERVKLLTGEKATKERMLEALAEAAKRAEPGGKVWFVFVGHGAPTRDGQDGVLLGSDTQYEADSLEQRGLRQSEAVAVLERSAAQPVLVVDACFSGKTGGGDVLIEGLQPVRLADVKAPSKAVVLAAAGAEQYAGPLPGAARPAFSYLVLGALRGWGDGATGESPNGEVTAEEAVAYANKAMTALVTGRKQEAELVGGGEKLALSKAGKERGPNLGEMARVLAEAEQGFNANGLVLPELPSMSLGAEATMKDVQGEVDLSTLDMEKEREFERQFKVIQAAERQFKLAQAAAKNDVTGEKQMTAWCKLQSLPEPNPHAKAADEACTKAKSYVEQRRRLVSAMERDWADKVVPFMGLESRTVEDKARVMSSFVNAYGVLAERPEVAEGKKSLALLETGNGRLPAWAGKSSAEVFEPTRNEARRSTPRSVLDYVRVAGGSFTDNEGTTHRIAAFEIGKTAVTVAQYEACVTARRCSASEVAEGSDAFCNYGASGKGDHPMNCVTWQEAVDYCEWNDGRLPTEWEWEWAARGREDGRTYAWGNEKPNGSTACWNRWESKEGTCGTTAHPQGASRDGVLGLSGNVYEWTVNWYTEGRTRVVRGGSWSNDSADDIRADFRDSIDPSERHGDVGFRCARTR